jgi:hypothetical protein
MTIKSLDIEQLRDRNAELERIVAAIDLDRHAAELAVVARFKFASDEQIAKWADVYPNKQAQEIARLTFLLAREQAKSEEVAAAHSILIQRLQKRRAAMSMEEFMGQYG